MKISSFCQVGQKIGGFPLGLSWLSQRDFEKYIFYLINNKCNPRDQWQLFNWQHFYSHYKVKIRGHGLLTLIWKLLVVNADSLWMYKSSYQLIGSRYSFMEVLLKIFFVNKFNIPQINNWEIYKELNVNFFIWSHSFFLAKYIFKAFLIFP